MGQVVIVVYTQHTTSDVVRIIIVENQTRHYLLKDPSGSSNFTESIPYLGHLEDILQSNYLVQQAEYENRKSNCFCLSFLITLFPPPLYPRTRCRSPLPYLRVCRRTRCRSARHVWTCRPSWPCCGAACPTPSCTWTRRESARGTAGWSSVWKPCR